jgi:hypothetical protein
MRGFLFWAQWANIAADELNRRGIATPKGAKWHALTVMRLRKRLAA